jgi:hypothetical protein
VSWKEVHRSPSTCLSPTYKFIIYCYESRTDPKDWKNLLGKDRTCATRDVTAAHATVKQLTKKVEGHGHKLYVDFFSSPNLFADLTKQKINCCGTVRPNRNGMPQNLLPWNQATETRRYSFSDKRWLDGSGLER